MFRKDFLSVSRTFNGLCANVVTDFILDKHSNFVAFFLRLNFFITFLHQSKKVNTKKPINNKLLPIR